MHGLECKQWRTVLYRVAARPKLAFKAKAMVKSYHLYSVLKSFLRITK